MGEYIFLTLVTNIASLTIFAVITKNNIHSLKNRIAFLEGFTGACKEMNDEKML